MRPRNFRRELIQSQLPQLRHAAEALQELLRRARSHVAYLRYYIGLDTKSATYNRGTAHELRHSIGIRMFRPIGKGFDYNWEPNHQWGNLGSAAIRAWSVSTEIGFTF